MKKVIYYISLLSFMICVGCTDREVIDRKPGEPIDPVTNLQYTIDGTNVIFTWTNPSRVPADIIQPVSIHIRVLRDGVSIATPVLPNAPETYIFSAYDPSYKYTFIVKVLGSVDTTVPHVSNQCYFSMPFSRRCRITFENDSPDEMPWLFYQVDYTLGDTVTEDMGRFHAHFRRENPCPLMRDYQLLSTDGSPGVFVGAVIGVNPLGPGWWGEGEMKFYIDGDTEYPTICVSFNLKLSVQYFDFAIAANESDKNNLTFFH